MLGQIVYHLSPRSNKPVLPGIIVNVRQAADDILNGVVDLHVFHPSSSGTNIVYGVKFSDKEQEGCWWNLPSAEEHKDHMKALAESKLETIRKTEESFKKTNQANIEAMNRRTK